MLHEIYARSSSGAIRYIYIYIYIHVFTLVCLYGKKYDRPMGYVEYIYMQKKKNKRTNRIALDYWLLIILSFPLIPLIILSFPLIPFDFLNVILPWVAMAEKLSVYKFNSFSRSFIADCLKLTSKRDLSAANISIHNYDSFWLLGSSLLSTLLFFFLERTIVFCAFIS